MFDSRRLMLIGVLASVSIGLGACSTFGLRGHTQSSAIDGRYDGMPSNSRLAGPPPTSSYSSPISELDLKRPAVSQNYASPEPIRQAEIKYFPVGRDEVGGSPSRYGSRTDGLASLKPVQRTAMSQQPDVPVQRRSAQIRPRFPVGAGVTPSSSQKLRDDEQAGLQTSTKAPEYTRMGWARWMGNSWRNHKTTSGELFDPNRLTGAHATLPLPSFLYVTNRSNGRTVLIRINDRVPASNDRVVIVSQLTADLLGFREVGRAKVDIQYAGPAGVEPNMKHEEAFLKHQPWFHPSMLHANHKLAETAKSSIDLTNPAGNRLSRRYPPPTYPRWDGSQRKP